ncbi:MAG TPA: mechanosensitive ion channel family protein [Candidatus Limnocylindria bacterium]
MELEPWVETTLKVTGILVVALLAAWAVRLAIEAAVRHLLERRALDEGQLTADDLERRVKTLQRLAVRIASALIGLIALLMILDQFEISIGPAIAGLGVVGIAVGFGAQTLIRDWLAGVFIILENQYSAGDVVRISGVDGVVEDFSLRRTTLRDLDGTVHTVPNGSIVVASNMTRGWARVNLDISVAYDTDIDRASAIIDDVGRSLIEDPEWQDRVIEAPSVMRVNALGDSAVALKVLGQVRPAEQWAEAGELRKRILAAFAEAGIEIPFPHRVMVTREPGSGTPAAREPEATEPPEPPQPEDGG